MLWPEIAEIAEKRKTLGITQGELAKLGGVSQPVICRVEGGGIKNPSYNVIRRIFEALETARGLRRGIVSRVPSEDYARDLMSPKVLSVDPLERVWDVWQLMHEKGFSQLPVISGTGKIMGSISEASIASIKSDDLLSSRVEHVMVDSFPIVGPDTKMSTIAALLKAQNAVLVLERGKVVGIITKFDIVENVFKKVHELHE